MRDLALSIPGFDNIGIQVNTGPGNPIPEPTLGGFLSGAFNIAVPAVAFVMLFWLLWGVFEYIFAGGEKEKLGKARSRITWAIVGFLFIVIAFMLYQYLQEIFPQKLPSGVTPISEPTP